MLTSQDEPSEFAIKRQVRCNRNGPSRTRSRRPMKQCQSHKRKYKVKSLKLWSSHLIKRDFVQVWLVWTSENGWLRSTGMVAWLKKRNENSNMALHNSVRTKHYVNDWSLFVQIHGPVSVKQLCASVDRLWFIREYILYLSAVSHVTTIKHTIGSDIFGFTER